MTGLLLKDLLYLKKQLKLLLLIFLFYLVLLVASGSKIEQFNAIFVTLIAMLPMIVITNAFAYDELSKWNSYALSLPVTKDKIVLCKYLLALMMDFCTALIPLFINAIYGNTNAESLASIYAAFGTSLLLCAILIPLFYRFGTQKARIALLIIILVPTIGGFLFKKAQLPLPSDEQINFWLALSPVFLIAFVAGSYFLSCRIFRNTNL